MFDEQLVLVVKGPLKDVIQEISDKRGVADAQIIRECIMLALPSVAGEAGVKVVGPTDDEGTYELTDVKRRAEREAAREAARADRREKAKKAARRGGRSTGRRAVTPLA